jgi:hypothetical protein
VPTMNTTTERVERQLGHTTQAGSKDAIETICTVGHSKNSTLTSRERSTTCGGRGRGACVRRSMVVRWRERERV